MGNFFGLTFFERRDVSLRMNGTEPLLLPSCAFSLSRWLIIKELNGGPVVQWRKVRERVKKEGLFPTDDDMHVEGLGREVRSDRIPASKSPRIL